MVWSLSEEYQDADNFLQTDGCQSGGVGGLSKKGGGIKKYW